MKHGTDAVSSHSGFIPFETVYYTKKRRGLLRPIARKKNLISVCSAAFFTMFLFNLVHSYKCRDNFINCFIHIFKNLTVPRIDHQFILPPSFKDIENKKGH